MIEKKRQNEILGCPENIFDLPIYKRNFLCIFLDTIKVVLIFFASDSVILNSGLVKISKQGYRNRYDIIDHGHEKNILCIFFIDLYLPG